LEEAAQADFLLHVADVSHPQVEDQMQVTSEVLSSLELDTRPTIMVLNKIDAAEPAAIERTSRLHPGAVCISAAKGEGLEALRTALADLMDNGMVEKAIRLRSADREAIGRIYAQSQVLDAQYHDGYVDLTIRASREMASALGRLGYPAAEPVEEAAQ
jgi:GTP-binding protein HflX